MAKRTRGVGVRNSHRPGGHPPARTSGSVKPGMGRAAEPPAAIPGAPPRPSASTGPVVTATAVAATASAVAARPVSRSLPGRVKVKPDSLLAARARDEYVYVGEDLRRIAVVAAILFGALFVLWFLLAFLNLSGLY